MKNLCILLIGFSSALSLNGQWVFIDKVINNSVEAPLSYTTSYTRFVRNAIYDDGRTRVNAVTTFLSTAGSNAIHWKRTTGGVTSTGSFSVPPTDNCDLVIGDAGNKILLAYQTAGSIASRIYQWNGSGYSQISSAIIAQVVYNPPYTVMQYGGPRLSIDQNDNIVVFYRSYPGTAPGSDIIYQFARAGDINGNWVNYPNSFNAFIVDQGLGLPTQYQGSFSDVGMTKYAANNMVSFAFPIVNLAGTNYLYLAQISYNDIASNNAGGLSYQTLASSTTNAYVFPSIDGANFPLQAAIQDDWVVAYDEIHGRNDVRVAKGAGGSFITYPYMSTLLQLDKQTGPPEIHYYSDYIGLAFTSNATNGCKEEWDPLYVELDQLGAVNYQRSYTRLNNDLYLGGDQAALSFSVSVGDMLTPYISYYDQVNQEIIESPLYPREFCGEVPIEDEEPKDIIQKSSDAQSGGSKNVLYTEIYSLDGRLVYNSKNHNNLSLPTGIYLVIKHYEDGSISKKKESFFK